MPYPVDLRVSIIAPSEGMTYQGGQWWLENWGGSYAGSPANTAAPGIHYWQYTMPFWVGDFVGTSNAVPGKAQDLSAGYATGGFVIHPGDGLPPEGWSSTMTGALVRLNGTSTGNIDIITTGLCNFLDGNGKILRSDPIAYRTPFMETFAIQVKDGFSWTTMAYVPMNQYYDLYAAGYRSLSWTYRLVYQFGLGTPVKTLSEGSTPGSTFSIQRIALTHNPPAFSFQISAIEFVVDWRYWVYDEPHDGCGDPYPIKVVKTEIPKDAQHEGLKPLSRDGVVYYPYAPPPQAWVPPSYNTESLLTTTAGFGSNTRYVYAYDFDGNDSIQTSTTVNVGSGWYCSQSKTHEEVLFRMFSGSGKTEGTNYHGYQDYAGGWPAVIGDLIIDPDIEGVVIDYWWSATGSFTYSYSTLGSDPSGINVIPPGGDPVPAQGLVVRPMGSATIYGEILFANGMSTAYLKQTDSAYGYRGTITTSGNTDAVGTGATLAMLREEGFLRLTAVGDAQAAYWVDADDYEFYHYDSTPPDTGWYGLPNTVTSATVTVNGPPQLVIYYNPLVPGYWTDDPYPNSHWYSNVIRAWKGDADQEQWVLPNTFYYEGVAGYWANNGAEPYFIDWTSDGVSVYVLTQLCWDPGPGPRTYYGNEPYVVWRINWETGGIDMMGIPMCANTANTPVLEQFTPRTVLAAGGHLFVGGGKRMGTHVSPAILTLPYDAPTQSSWNVSYIDYGSTDGYVTTFAGESGTNKWYATVEVYGGSYELVSWSSDAWYKIRTPPTTTDLTAIWAYDDQALFIEQRQSANAVFTYTPDAGASWMSLCEVDPAYTPATCYGGLTWHRDFVLFPVRDIGWSSDYWGMGIFKKVDEETAPVVFIGNTVTMDWGGPWFGTADASAEFPPGLVTGTPGVLSWAELIVPNAPIGGVGYRVLYGSGYVYGNIVEAPRRYALSVDGGTTWTDITDSVTDYNVGDIPTGPWPAANATYPFYLAPVSDILTGEPGGPITIIRDANDVNYRVVWEVGHPEDYGSHTRTLAIRGFGQDTTTGDFVDFVFARIGQQDLYAGQPAWPTDLAGWTADATNFYVLADHQSGFALWQINRTTRAITALGTANAAASQADHGCTFDFTGNTEPIYPHTFQGIGMLAGDMYLGGTDSELWTGLLRVSPGATSGEIIYGPENTGYGEPWIVGVMDGDPARLWVTYADGQWASNTAQNVLYTYEANGAWTDVTAGLVHTAPWSRLWHIHTAWAGSGGRALAVYYDILANNDVTIRMCWTSDAGHTWSLVWSGLEDANTSVYGELDLGQPLSAVESDGVVTLTVGEYWYPDPNVYASETTFHTFQIDANTGAVTDLGVNKQLWQTGDVGISIPGRDATWPVVSPTTTNCDLQYATIFGGNTVIVTGENFTPGTVLAWGNPFPVENLTATYVNTTTMSFVTTNAISTQYVGPGKVYVQAYAPYTEPSWDPWSGTANVFLQMPPANFTSIAPASGPVTGLTAVMITGNTIYWKNLTSIGFDSAPVAPDSRSIGNNFAIISNTQVFCTVPDMSWLYNYATPGGILLGEARPVLNGMYSGGQGVDYLFTELPEA